MTRKIVKIHEKGVVEKGKENPKAFWNYVNKKFKVKSNIPDLYVEDDESSDNMTKSDSEKAERLGEFFAGVFTNEIEELWDLANKPECKKKIKLVIDKEIILKKLRKLKVSKSPGPDGIYPRILHETGEKLVNVLMIIFKTSLATGKLPRTWKDANISAIHKKGSKHRAGNYRPVSLTSIVCKILESIIRDAIVEYMKENLLFSGKQFGFIGGRSTSLQLLKVLDRWTEMLDCVDVIYCDFMKAFDTVPHGRLAQVLEFYNFDVYIVDWIRSVLSQRRQRVVVNRCESTWHDVKSGIPQGSVLVPVLFVIYINTMVDRISDSEVFLYADDTKVFHEISNMNDVEALQADLNNMLDWSKESLLRFHPDKCVCMRIGKSPPNIDVEACPYSMEGKQLERSEEKDLVVVIDTNWNFDKHISSKINKAKSIAGLIRRCFEYLDAPMFKMLFTALVRPHLEYAQSVWSPYLKKHIEAIEKVQRRASKRVPELDNMTYEDRLRELKLPTLCYRRYRGDMIEIFKITHGFYDNLVPENFLNLKENKVNTRGHTYKIDKKGCRLNIRLNSFRFRTVDQWNTLPNMLLRLKPLHVLRAA